MNLYYIALFILFIPITSYCSGCHKLLNNSFPVKLNIIRGSRVGMKYQKKVIKNTELYISTYVKNESLPYILWVHGGPGLNSATLEKLVEEHNLFENLNYNIVFYDQRGAGRSFQPTEIVTHQNNIDDLSNVIKLLEVQENLKIKSIAGHSYGAKVLFDFYEQTESEIPAIFVAATDSILTPRLNNLKLDLEFLKSTNSKRATEILKQFDTLSLAEIWNITRELAPLFLKNKLRPSFYWSNLDWYKKILAIQKDLSLPINHKTFMSVREDLYRSALNLDMDINQLDIKKIWINGAKDLVMRESDPKKNSFGTIFFSESAHSPHIEENLKFGEVVNEFLDNL